MEILIELTGVTPLVMHSSRLIDSEDEIVRSIAELTGKRNKTDEDFRAVAKLEFLGGLYYDHSVGVHVPSWNLIRTFEQAGKATRQGTDIIRAVHLTTDKIPLIYSGPKTPEELWELPEHRFRTAVGVQRNKIIRMRPIFRQWQLSFEVELETDIMNPRDFEGIVAKAGRVEGLGDARKLGNGRFTATVHYDESAQ